MNTCCQQPNPTWFNDATGGYVLTCANCSTRYTPDNQHIPVIDFETMAKLDLIVDKVVASRGRVASGVPFNEDEAESSKLSSGKWAEAWHELEVVVQTKNSWGKKTMKTATDLIAAKLVDRGLSPDGA